MVIKTPGVGSVYLGTFKDKGGNWLDGANTYRLHVLPNPPVTQFWSIMLYDVSARALMTKNADGSVALYFSPKAGLSI